MLTADYSAEIPDIDVKSTGWNKDNLYVIQIGEVELTLCENDARELCEDLYDELFADTLASEADKLEQATDKIYQLEDEISGLKDYIRELEGE